MTQPTADMPAFPLLADPDGYRPCLWDLNQHPQRRAYWLALFRSHFPKLLATYRKEADERGEDIESIDRRASDAQDRFYVFLDMVEADPEAVDDLNILKICYAREKALRAAGIDDPYRLAKRIDTEHALQLLPSLLSELDAVDESARRLAVIQGVFAGNIYDLGATKTVEMFSDDRVDFHDVRSKLKPRPWYFDDLDAWLARLNGPPHRAACLFVDNAGPDVTLGMIPFARFLLQRGTDVILTSNPYPSLNDITHDELGELIVQIAAFDAPIREALAQGRLTLVPSGNNAPLIDLAHVSDALAQAVTTAGVDLVVIEGMGRAVETNLDAKLSCDCLKLAMIKDEGVAEALGAGLFDLVMKFEPRL